MTPSQTRITPDSFLTKVGTSKDGEPIIVYFVPGNPGVVSYYHYFLALVASNLSSSESAASSSSFAPAVVAAPLACGAAPQQQEQRARSYESSTRSCGQSSTNSSGSSAASRDGRAGFKSRINSVRRRKSKEVETRERDEEEEKEEEEKVDEGSLSTKREEILNYPNTNSEESYLITGRSLAGFEIEEEGAASAGLSSCRATFSFTDKMHGLAAQVEYVEDNLAQFVRKYQRKVTAAATEAALAAGQEKDAVSVRKPRPKVILLGHSVGAYISMELLRNRKEREKTRAVKAEDDAGASSDRGKGDDEEVEMDIIGGLMLFPAVVDIAKSPSGKTMTTLLNIPYLHIIASLVAKGLMSLFPSPIVRRLIRYVLKGAPDDPVDTTIAFLKSRTGVQQALYLTAEEMEQIGADKWSDEIWGISEEYKPSDDAKSQLTKLVFYFGRNDHWVAEKTRDEIIQARASQGGRGPKMVVCEDGIEHAFCIRHNEIMADKVSGYIREIVNDYRSRE
ncbi:hypothetical protein PRK78_001868 [Emydomyces testavorans]|uniref:Lipid droplet-associated hydrolase n=1 Tax=Emydomyces testavorans TaxID=2070801 RepID=A0AAF0IFX7_9EURO|nr:hypothetical protein PRK78_001868 [Emydomyces testavorans]